MEISHYFSPMADYNRWMNQRLYAAASDLDHHTLWADRQAFFGSILGTFNHLLVGDLIWLRRFAGQGHDWPSLGPVQHCPTPQQLDEVLCDNLNDAWQLRQQLDAIICDFAAELSSEDEERVLRYYNTAGEAQAKPLVPVLQHFFNHQTHHRGQLTTLLHQAGVDVGVTDLMVRIPNAD